jgi:hypothetical protein
MINFSKFLYEEKDPLDLSEEDIDSMVNNLTWKDIEDLYTEDDFENEMNEAISASERLKRAQRMRVKEPLLKKARKIKLKRPSPMPVLKKRSQLAARNLIYKKFMKGRDKSQLSPSEKDMVELRVRRIMKVYKNLPQKLMPKIRELERSRLAGTK